MTDTRRPSLKDEPGFTLVELLVVVLIIGILAAIALPSYLGQGEKGRDANAKSNARNMVSHMEACWLDDQTFVGCDANVTAAHTGLPVGAGAGRVSVTNLTRHGYRVVSVSEARTAAGVNHIFYIDRADPGVVAFVCTPQGVGGCAAGGVW